MANLPRCSGCVHRKNAFGTICAFYPKEIPKNILAEKQQCEHYSDESIIKRENNYDDLPIAKGR